MERNPDKRITVKQALDHPWITENMNFTNLVSPQIMARSLNQNQAQKNLLQMLKLNILKKHEKSK